MQLIPVVYDANDLDTDFTKMIENPRYMHNSLFLFNDNFRDRNQNVSGGNSAKIRPYTFCVPPRSAGISTGWSSKEGGFPALDDDVKEAISLCFEMINAILNSHTHIKRVFYACDPRNHQSIGLSLFKPASTVIDFINMKLHEIPTRFQNMVVMSEKAFFLLEKRLEEKREKNREILQQQMKKKQRLFPFSKPLQPLLGMYKGRTIQKKPLFKQTFLKHSA
jgi:hypothetical protein